jgi:hypothetical protein
MQSARYFCRILRKIQFSLQIFKNSQISNFMRIHLVRVQLFHADRRTDMTKLTDTFHNFVNAPKMSA